jgi:hypothetical protein
MKSDMPPDIDQLVFDPHVLAALLLLLVALVIVFAVSLIPVEDDPERRREKIRDRDHR